MILVMTEIAAIPVDILEAAEVDGANAPPAAGSTSSCRCCAT